MKILFKAEQIVLLYAVFQSLKCLDILSLITTVWRWKLQKTVQRERRLCPVPEKCMVRETAPRGFFPTRSL